MFKFNLDSVLKHRQRLEDVAQREYAEAQAEVSLVLTELESLYASLESTRDAILEMQRRGHPGGAGEIQVLEQFIEGQKIRIERTRDQARQKLAFAETKQEELIIAAQDKEVLEKLKEKRKVEYLQQLERIAVKEADDQTMIRQSWRRR